VAKSRLLAVDDEPGVRQFLKAALARDYEVALAENGREALEALARRSYALVLTDGRMPGMTGQELLEQVRALYPETAVILLTAYGTVEDAVAAMKAGAADYLTKPLKSPEELRLRVARVLEQEALARRVRVLEEKDRRDPRSLLLYADPAMSRLVETARMAAAEPVEVLITGESGTGKEVLARFLHESGPRAGQSFLAVNCAAFNENLIESELFGHEKGAFTGAGERRAGKFEAAEGGTLFLDEIGEVPLHLQAKLLRVLQEKTLERLGSNRQIPVDIRVIAATNRDLDADRRSGKFREDLFFRLAVFPLHIPPLRERPADILLLARHFLEDAGRRRGKAALELSAEAARALEGYAWPGNVRELQNLMERLSIVAPGPGVDEGMLPPEIHARPTGPAPEQRSLAEVEREHILGILKAMGGNRTRAAQVLQISLRSLQYKLKEYGEAGEDPSG
jgi:DNA-binding NtrC family response regulator